MALHADLQDADDLHRIGVIQASDPGAIGAGKVWIDSDDNAVRIRNADDSGWIGPLALQGTNALDISVPDEAYDATNWNGSLEVPTKNAVRDKIEALSVGSGALVFLERHVASSSAQLDFTTFISGTYDKYLIIGEGIVPASNAVDFRLTVGTGGTPTYDTGNNYEWSHMRYGTNGASGVGAGTTGVAKIFTTMRNSSGDGGSFSLTATHLQSTTQRKFFNGSAFYVDNTGPLSVGQSSGIQWLTFGTAVTALRFDMSSGNITSGSITIYGYTNS